MKTKGFLCLIAVLVWSTNNSALAQGSAFTYQGRLTSGGNPAKGTFDFRFSLFDSSSLGNQVAGPLTNSSVAVSDGFFAAVLDFGAGAFTGTNLWLKVEVRTHGAAGFTTLGPLQPLTPAPYAITAGNLTGPFPAAKLTGALPSSLLAGAFTNPVTLSNLSNSLAGSFTGSFYGNGSGLTNLTVPVTNLVGTIPNSLLPATMFSSTNYRGVFYGDGHALTNLNLNWDCISLLQHTRVGTTLAAAHKGAVSNILYLPSGEGVLRAIEYTSFSTDFLSDRTNRSIRIYADAGTISDPSNPPAANLIADFPIGNITCSKYFDRFGTNFNTALAFGTRYVGWVEVSTNASAFNATNYAALAHYTITLRYPCPFTNGIYICLWDTKNNALFTSGFSWASYDSGTVPGPLRSLRLRTYRQNYSPGTCPTNITILDYTGAGEVVSVFCSPLVTIGAYNGFWEGTWGAYLDSNARIDFGCAGGEDMFNNGYYLDGSFQDTTSKTNKTMVTWDWGTRYIHEIAYETYIAECYRHFSEDAHQWQSSARIQFECPPGFNNSLAWDSIVVFYGQ